MSHQDSYVKLNAACLSKSIQYLLGKIDFTSLGFRQDCTWLPMQLVAAAILWAWSDEQTLHARFHHARKIILFLFSPQEQPGNSYQGFIKLLVKWTDSLIALLQVHLRARMQKCLAANWLLHGFAVFAVDGSRIELPRTQSHQHAYGRKKKTRYKRRAPQKQSAGPQMWLTTLFHLGTGLPWHWRTGPMDSSEREHLLEMLPSLPANSLMTADAGFVGYAFIKTVIDSGRHLLVRMGANVRLLKNLGYVRERNCIVYLWPSKVAKQLQRPIVLRLLVLHNGKHPVYLVTSVLNQQRLSNTQLAELYGRRWGVELFYRHLKQTFQRRKLRSSCAENAHVELEWSLVGLWTMSLYAQVEMCRQDIPPQRMSVAGILFAFRQLMRYYREPQTPHHSLRENLRRAVIDNYKRRCKTSRNYPRKKQDSPPGAPTISLANASQIALAKTLAVSKIQKGLPA